MILSIELEHEGFDLKYSVLKEGGVLTLPSLYIGKEDFFFEADNGEWIFNDLYEFLFQGKDLEGISDKEIEILKSFQAPLMDLFIEVIKQKLCPYHYLLSCLDEDIESFHRALSSIHTEQWVKDKIKEPFNKKYVSLRSETNHFEFLKTLL